MESLSFPQQEADICHVNDGYITVYSIQPSMMLKEVVRFVYTTGKSNHLLAQPYTENRNKAIPKIEVSCEAIRGRRLLAGANTWASPNTGSPM